MRKAILLLSLTLLLNACDSWGIAPQPFPVWTTAPTSTPNIITPTPLIISPPTITPIISTIAPATETASPTPPPATLTSALPTETFTSAPQQAVAIEILGCNTSLDISHGMGEVTNAYVALKNTGNVDLPNTCALLRAIDEGAVAHPDKQACVSNLPAQNQVILKLTVDSTYQQNTIIQVDASSNSILLLRIDKQSCRDISLFGGAPSNVGVIKPIQP
jgi:hypothetical protein